MAVTPVAPSAVAAVAQVTATQVAAVTPVSAPSVLSQISKALLGTGPDGTPAAAPAMWVMAAAARRELGKTAEVIGATGAGAEALPAPTATAAATPNHNPVISSVGVGKPNTSTGVVSGSVKATDADKDSLTYTATGAVKGAVSIESATGVFSYTPTPAARHAASAAGAASSVKSDSFTVTVTDDNGGSASKTVTVAVAPDNKAPTIAPTVGTPDPVTGVVTGNLNVTDVDGDAVSISTTAKPKKGTVTVLQDGSFSYKPTAAAMHAASVPNAPVSATSDTFTVKVVDGHGGSASQTLTVTIAPANTAPTVTTGPTVTKTNGSTGVVTGKITVADADKDSLKYTGTAANGKVTVSSNGTFTYTPTAAARHAASADGAPAADTTDTVSITVSDGHGASLTENVSVTIVGKNTAPSMSTTVGKADTTTGSVTGTIKVTDVDKDTTTYSVVATSAKGGTVSIDATGKFTYTASDALRYAAGAQGAAGSTKTDTITVSVADGHGGTTTKTVTVGIAPLTAQTQGSVTNTGSLEIGGTSYNAVFNRDGTRAIITTTTGAGGTSPSYTVVDPRTAGKIGTAIAVAGSPWKVEFSADGTRAVVYTDGKDASGNVTTNVAVINAVSGVQLGSTVSLSGTISTAFPFSAQGDRVVVVAHSTDASNNNTARLAVVDLTTGLQVGTTSTFTGDSDDSSVKVQLNAQGTRAVVTVETKGADANLSTALSVIDTGTGIQLGSTGVFGGQSYGGVQLSADGSRAVLAVANFVVDSATNTVTANNTVVTVYDLATGTTSTYGQDGIGSARLSADGSRLVVNTGTTNATGSYIGLISTYNTLTGLQVGTGVQLSGLTTYLPPQFAGDQTHVVVGVYSLVSVNGANYISNAGTVVIDTSTGKQVGDTVRITGEPIFDGSTPVNVQLNAGGSRAVITTISNGVTRIAVVDTATGKQVGKVFSVTGTVQVDSVDMLPVFTADGKTAIVTAFTGSDAKGYTTHVAVLSLVTGVQTGKTVNVAGGVDTADGNWYPVVQLGTSGTRVLITTFAGDYDNGFTSRVAMINTLTGAQLGSTRAYTGDWPAWTQFSDDGNRVLVETDSGWGTSKARSVLTLFDAYTGTQMGAATTYPADGWTWGTFYNDGSRLAMTGVSGDDAHGYSTRITVVDPISGAVIGSPLTIIGNGESTVFGADNGQMLVTTVTGNDSTGYTTTVSFVTISNGGSAVLNT
ncbi:MAG: Ig-like domain-containing protein [Mycobacterium sp.]